MDRFRTAFTDELVKVAFREAHQTVVTGPKNALMLPALFGAAGGLERERPNAATYGGVGGAAAGGFGGAYLTSKLRPRRPGLALAAGLAGLVGGAAAGTRLLGGKVVSQVPDYEVKGRAILIKMPHEEAAIAIHKPFGFDALSEKTKQDWVRGMVHYVEHKRKTGEPIGS